MWFAAGVAGPVDYNGRRIDPESPSGHHAQQRARQSEAVAVSGEAVPVATLAFQVIQH